MTHAPEPLVVFFAPAPVEGTFYQVCRQTAAGLHTVMVVDVVEEGDARIVRAIQQQRAAGGQVELDRFAQGLWGHLLGGT
jgi:hypothetical protein